MNKYIRTSAKLLSCILSVLMLLSNLQPAIYAAENTSKNYTYETVTLALNSNEDNRSTIEMYYIGDVAFISIEDLCSLTRSQSSTKGNKINVSHGILTECTFDPETETFTDHQQCVSVNIIPLPNGDYAVPALPFLYYYQATAWISDNTLYSNMPNFTVWEALDLDLNYSIVDYVGLFGGYESAKWSIILSVINEFFLGKPMNWEKYMDTAISYSLSVDIFSYSSVQDYIKETNLQMEDYLQSEKAQKYLTALELVSPAGREAIKHLISRHYDASFKNLVLTSANAFHNGDRVKYLDFLDEAFDELDTKAALNNSVDEIFLYAEWMAIGASAFTNAYQAMNLNNETDRLIYKVLGSENLTKLGLYNDRKDWGKRADVFKNNNSIAAEQYNQAVWEFFTQTTTSAKETLLNEALTNGTFNFNYGGTVSFGLKLGQHIAAQFPSSKAMHENLNLLNLVNLQEACGDVLVATAQKVDADPANAELLCEYLPVLQLYLRVSIACYSKFAEYIDKYASEHTDIKADFEKRANQFAVDLYRVSTLTSNDPEVFCTVDLHQYFLTPAEQGISISTVEIFENGELYAEDNYQYNENGFLTLITRTPVNSATIFTEIFYDNAGRMTKKTVSEGTVTPFSVKSYAYGKDGLLQSHTVTENGVYGYQYSTTYQYDSQSRISRAITTWKTDNNRSSVSDYTYDALGHLSQVHTTDSYGSEHWFYEYDEQGRMILATYTRAYSESFSIQYSYDHAPFIVSVTPDLGEEFPIHSAYFTDRKGHEIYSYQFSNPTYITNSDGYVTQVIDSATNRVYKFNYTSEESTSDAPSNALTLYEDTLNLYKTALEDCSSGTTADTQNKYTSINFELAKAVYNKNNAISSIGYALHDINGDGIDELLIGGIVYSGFYIGAIHTHDGSSPITLLIETDIPFTSVNIYPNGVVHLHSEGMGSTSRYFKLDSTGSFSYLGGIASSFGSRYAIDKDFNRITVDDIDSFSQKLYALADYENRWNGTWTPLT